MTAPTAVCRVDGEPLVSTLAFIHKEFVCVVCGRTYGFLEPASAPSTVELTERADDLRARFHAERDEDANHVIQETGDEWDQLDGRTQRAMVAALWIKRHA